MVERMVADAVSALYYHTEHIRVLTDVVAYHEKGCLDVVFVQQFQYPRRHFRDGTVVKGQVNSLFVRVHPEDGVGIDCAEKPRRLLYKHLLRLQITGGLSCVPRICYIVRSPSGYSYRRVSTYISPSF